jgi:hypothetical protein
VIGLKRRSVLSGTREYVALGPLWAGVVLRAVTVFVTTPGPGSGMFSFAVCSSGAEVEGNFLAGERLIQGDSVVAGTTDSDWVLFFTASGSMHVIRVPVYAAIREGPAFLVAGLAGNIAMHLGVAIDFEPERLVAPSVERGPAARLPRSSGRVLEDLRAEALAAQS